MTKVLLVYEMVPEETLIYLLDVEDADLKWMKKCHRHFLNSKMSAVSEKACAKLSVYLEDKPKLDHKNDKDPIDIKGYDLLIVSGFIL
jgi:hypothetical protein